MRHDGPPATSAAARRQGLPPPLTDRRIVRRGMAVLRMAVCLQPRPFLVAVGGAVLSSLMIVGASVVLGEVTDRVVLPAFRSGRTSNAALAVAGAVILGMGIGKAAGIAVRRVAAAAMQYRLQGIFRTRVAHRYQQLPLSWHRRHSTGELLSNANADVDSTFGLIAPLPYAVGTAALLVLTAVVLLVTDWVLALLGLVVGPAIAVLTLRYNARVAEPATRAQEGRAAVSSVAHESFDGALVVKTLGREQHETQRFAAASERLRDDLIATGRLRALFDPFVEGLPTVGVLVVLVAGAWRIELGHLQPGELVRVAYLFTLLAFPLRVLGFFLGEIPRSVVGWERVQRVLDAPDEVPYGHAFIAADGGGGAVELASVSLHHDRSPALTDLELRVRPGQMVAIVGPTGSGKSTIAALLARLEDPDTGSASLDGVDLRTLRRGVIPHHVAVVFQEPFLFDESVRDNITLGDPYSDAEVRTAAEIAQAHGFIAALPDGYATVVGERGGSLSGGQRQRIALARALVRRPRVLVLDDATSAVDTAVERAILEGLRAADLPSTVIVVAARRATVALSDEVVVVDGGRVRSRGRHDDLVERDPFYRRLLGAEDTRSPV